MDIAGVLLAVPLQGEEPSPWWAVATPIVLGLIGTFYLIRHRTRPGPTARAMEADRFLSTAAEGRLTKRLATGYLLVVAFVWLGHVVGLVMSLVTGRSSWTTENPWIVFPMLLVLASAVGTVWWVERQLYRDRPPITQALRMIGLAYGLAVPVAWRRLRSTED